MKAAKRFKTQEKSSWQGKKSEEKEQKKCFEKEVVDAPFESNNNTLLKNISSEVIHADVIVNAMNDEVSTVSSKIRRTN